MKHVTLYSYLKAFRFTGSPVLYLECEIHMCQSSCPPQMCYWRRLSKRSASNETTASAVHDYPMLGSQINARIHYQPDDFLNEEFSTDDGNKANHYNQEGDSIQLGNETKKANSKTASKRNTSGRRQLRKLNFGQDNGDDGDNIADASGTGNVDGSSDKEPFRKGGYLKGRSNSVTTVKPLSLSGGGQISDKVSLFQALEVRQERERDPDGAPFSSSGISSLSSPSSLNNHITALDNDKSSDGTFVGFTSSLMCYRRAEVLAFLFTTVSIILVAISISVGFCWRAANLRKIQRSQDKTIAGISGGLSSANLISRISSINNLLCENPNSSTDTASMSSCSISPSSLQREPNNHHHHQYSHYQQSQSQHHHHHNNNHNNKCVIDSSLISHPNQLRLSPILQHQLTRHKERPL